MWWSVCDYIYVLSERRRRLLKGTGIEVTEIMAVAITMTRQMTTEEGCGWRDCSRKGQHWWGRGRDEPYKKRRQRGLGEQGQPHPGGPSERKLRNYSSTRRQSVFRGQAEMSDDLEPVLPSSETKSHLSDEIFICLSGDIVSLCNPGFPFWNLLHRPGWPWTRRYLSGFCLWVSEQASEWAHRSSFGGIEPHLQLPPSGCI